MEVDMRRWYAMSAFALIVSALTSTSAHVAGGQVTAEAGITRRVMIDQPTVQVMRTTYAPGAVEPPGPHAFDVVIVPLTAGHVSVNVAAKPVDWKIGEAIFIPRGVQHNLANTGKTPIEFVSVRIR